MLQFKKIFFWFSNHDTRNHNAITFAIRVAKSNKMMPSSSSNNCPPLKLQKKRAQPLYLQHIRALLWNILRFFF